MLPIGCNSISFCQFQPLRSINFVLLSLFFSIYPTYMYVFEVKTHINVVFNSFCCHFALLNENYDLLLH